MNYIELTLTIVKDGSIKNNGIINGNGELTVARGFGETLTNGVNGEISNKVIIEGASHTLAELKTTPVSVAEYKAAAKVTNYGEMNEVQVDGKLVLESNSRIVTVTMTSGAEGEIDNTHRGVIEDDPSSTGVTVYATFAGLNLVDKTAQDAAKAEFDEYKTSYRVTEVHLTGEVVIGNADVTFNKSTSTNTITELVFAEGSSLSIGDAEFESDFDISVAAKNVKWTGNTKTSSTFDLTGLNGGKKLYMYENTNGQYTATEGNVVFENCEEVTGLK